MRVSMMVLAMLMTPAMLAAGVQAHSDGTCPFRTVTSLGAGYEVSYSATDKDIYIESGVREGVQTGANHALLGALGGHDHRCYWPVAAERDYFMG